MAPADIDAAVHRQLGELVAGMRGLQDSIRRLEEGAVRSEDKAAASRAGVHTRMDELVGRVGHLGHDLRGMEQQERRMMLEDAIDEGGSVIRLSEEIEGDGAAILEAACEFGLEGIIAKDRRAPYRSGRMGDWLKLKCNQSDGFIVVGFEPSTKVTGAISRLLLAARRGNELVYVGGVGTGFSDKMARDLRQPCRRRRRRSLSNGRTPCSASQPLSPKSPIQS